MLPTVITFAGGNTHEPQIAWKASLSVRVPGCKQPKQNLSDLRRRVLFREDKAATSHQHHGYQIVGALTGTATPGISGISVITGTTTF